MLGRLLFWSEQPGLLKRAYPDDILLVGYPKSGNTWVRFLIGNYLTRGECSFSNSHEIVPGLEENSEQCEWIDRPRFIHSHFTYGKISTAHPNFVEKLPQVVFVVRDGRDVAVSYYYHLLKQHLIGSDTKFGQYIEMLDQGKFYPYIAWGKYIDQWLDVLNSGANNWLLLRYEDLKENPGREFTRFLKFTGYHPDEDLVEISVAASSFENMKKMEERQELQHRGLRESDKSIRFIRDGTVGQWVTHFNTSIMEKFERVNGRALMRLDYV